MAYIDYYQVLGVDRKASQDDIKKRSVNWHASIIPI